MLAPTSYFAATMAKSIVVLFYCWVILCYYSVVANCFEFNCIEECFGNYSSGEHEISCRLLENAMECYNNNREICSNAGHHINLVMDSLRERECDGPTPPPPTTPPCPHVPQQLPDAELVDEAIIRGAGPGITQQCHMPDMPTASEPLVQCSLFVYSHLRPFKFIDTQDSIETCSLPGAWQLFHHQDMMVEVEGQAEQEMSVHTLLTKVNVTFPASGECNTEPRSYIALNNLALPRTFEGVASETDTNSPLQLHFSDSGSVVTVRAHWINSTIIIRRIGEFLSVTIQVTGQMAFQAQGLCTAACPRHQYVDALMYTRLNSCSDQRNTATFDCFVRLGQELLEVSDITYTDACVYSTLRGASSHVGPMLTAIVADAKLLPNRGRVPRPSAPSPVTPITRPLQTTPTNIVTTPDRVISTGEVGRSASVTPPRADSTQLLFDTVSAGHSITPLFWLVVTVTALLSAVMA